MSLTEISAADAAKLVNRKAGVIVDVREPHEIARERIPGAITIPLSQISEDPIALPGKAKALFICASGARTRSGAPRLARTVNGKGHTVSGGMIAWKSAGLPVEVPSDAGSRKARLIWKGSTVLLFAALGLAFYGMTQRLNAFGIAGLAAALVVIALRGPVISALVGKTAAKAKAGKGKT